MLAAFMLLKVALASGPLGFEAKLELARLQGSWLVKACGDHGELQFSLSGTQASVREGDDLVFDGSILLLVPGIFRIVDQTAGGRTYSYGLDGDTFFLAPSVWSSSFPAAAGKIVRDGWLIGLEEDVMASVQGTECRLHRWDRAKSSFHPPAAIQCTRTEEQGHPSISFRYQSDWEESPRFVQVIARGEALLEKTLASCSGSRKSK